jgi:hypothetical protein
MIEILTGLGITLALLYFWLLAHWFARIVMFLLLCPVLWFAGAALGARANDQWSWIPLGLLGLALAWPVASLPLYYRRHKRLPY